MEENVQNTDKSPYLSFKLGDENFAVHVQQVREIIELFPITKIPHSPAHLKGIINLRGNIVPVIDLRIKFDLDESAVTKKTRIIIFEVERDGMDEKQVLGGIVDQTHDVLNIERSAIEEPPSVDEHEYAVFLKGIFKYEEAFYMLLDVGKILSKKEVEALSDASIVEND